jgi:hypothetical protein
VAPPSEPLEAAHASGSRRSSYCFRHTYATFRPSSHGFAPIKSQEPSFHLSSVSKVHDSSRRVRTYGETTTSIGERERAVPLDGNAAAGLRGFWLDMRGARSVLVPGSR